MINRHRYIKDTLNCRTFYHVGKWKIRRVELSARTTLSPINEKPAGVVASWQIQLANSTFSSSMHPTDVKDTIMEQRCSVKFAKHSYPHKGQRFLDAFVWTNLTKQHRSSSALVIDKSSFIETINIKFVTLIKIFYMRIFHEMNWISEAWSTTSNICNSKICFPPPHWSTKWKSYIMFIYFFL